MKKRLTIIMTLLCVLLLISSAFVYLSKDRSGPEILFDDSSINYREGEDLTALLENVTAVDSRDGDVSDTLKVDQVTTMQSMDYVVITYVARDHSNNITKQERWINLKDGSTSEEPLADMENILEEESEQTLARLLNDQDETAEETEETETEETETEETEENETELPLVSYGDPVIRLNTHEVVLHQGDSFDYYDYIDDCVDDKDDRDELYSRIAVNGYDADGNYVGAGLVDTSRLTTYSLQVYVSDSEGNISNIERLKVVIEE